MQKRPEVEDLTPEQMRRNVLRAMLQLQAEFKTAEDEYQRLTRKRREVLRAAAKIVPVTDLAKTLRISRQKIYQIIGPKDA